MGNRILKSDLRPEEEMSSGEEQYPNLMPFNNLRIQEYCRRYQLSASEVFDLHAIFKHMDRRNEGVVGIDHFLELLQETPNSIVYPYLAGVFKFVKKGQDTTLDFFEW